MKKIFTFLLCLLPLLHAGDSWMEQPLRDLNIIDRYRPHLNHYFQMSYEYGIYEEKKEVPCLINKKIFTIKNRGLDDYIVSGNQLFHLSQGHCVDEITVDDLIVIKTIKIIPIYSFIRGLSIFHIHILVSADETLDETSNIVRYKVIPTFEKIDKMQLKDYWKTHEKNPYILKDYVYQKPKQNKYGVYAIIDAPNKQFTVAYKDKRFLTTHLQNTPEYITHQLPEDLFYVVFSDQPGLHIYENIRKDNYTKVQNTVKKFIEQIITPWWRKPDLDKINIDNGKLERFIALFNPYEIDQRHQIQYKVMAYSNNTSDVQIVVDKKHTTMFKLAKDDDWKVEDLEFK